MQNLTNGSFRRAIIALVIGIFLFAAQTALAKDIHVRGDCELRDAIRAATYNTAIGGCVAGSGPGDIIILYENITKRRTLPEITTDITLEGRGRTLTFKDRIPFVVNEGKLTLQNIKIRFEATRSDDVLFIDDGALTLANAYFHDCTGGMDVEGESTIQLLGQFGVCGHSREVIWAWFDYEPPRPPTCVELTGAVVTASQGLESGVQCRDVTAAGVGNQTVYDAGFIAAVDVWGDLGPGVEICFPQIGALMFLDAAAAPRVASSLASYGVGGSTCASLNRAGMVVLVQGQPTTPAPPAVVSEPEPEPEQEPEPAPVVSEPGVDGCPIRTTGHINFRAEPSLEAEKLGVVLRGSTVGAISRIVGWYQINFLGRTGWIGGKYVDNIGDCQ